MRCRPLQQHQQPQLLLQLACETARMAQLLRQASGGGSSSCILPPCGATTPQRQPSTSGRCSLAPLHNLEPLSGCATSYAPSWVNSLALGYLTCKLGTGPAKPLQSRGHVRTPAERVRGCYRGSVWRRRWRTTCGRRLSRPAATTRCRSCGRMASTRRAPDCASFHSTRL